MICKNCGAQTEGNFCNNCGAPLPKEVAGNNESMDAEYKVYTPADWVAESYVVPPYTAIKTAFRAFAAFASS